MDMDELLFVAHSETAGDIGCVNWTKDDLVAFVAVESGTCSLARL